jgi:predicted aspartyl protease
MAACLSASLGLSQALASSDGTTCIETRRAAAELLLVPVEVAATGMPGRSYWFLLDTGSGVTIADGEVAKALKLAPSARTTVVTMGGPIEAITSRLSVTFGAVRVDDLEVVHSPLTEVRAIDPDIHGILGQDVLRRTNWLLDHRRGVVIQDPSRTLAPRIGGERVPVRWIGERPAVDVSFGRSAPVRLVLDSAANGIVLFRLLAGSATSGSSHLTTLGAGKEAPVYTADTLRIGSTTLAHPAAAVLPQDRDLDEADGVLPTSLFDSLYFDQHDGAALVTPPTSTTSPGGRRRIIRPRCEAAASLSS